jgi:hypothetical protein
LLGVKKKEIYSAEYVHRQLNRRPSARHWSTKLKIASNDIACHERSI